jgi:hypothetical protein
MRTAPWKTGLALAAAAIDFACFGSARAQELDLKTNQFDYQSVQPKNPAHMPIYEILTKVVARIQMDEWPRIAAAARK